MPLMYICSIQGLKRKCGCVFKAGSARLAWCSRHEASIKCECMLDMAKSGHVVGILGEFSKEFSYGKTIESQSMAKNIF